MTETIRMEESRKLEQERPNRVISHSFSDDNYEYDIQDLETGDAASYYSEEAVKPKSCNEKVGECLVGITCTGTVALVLSLCVVIAAMGLVKIVVAGRFWTDCPASPRLPVLLLISGLAPILFYLTCRTRRKNQKGAAPEKQRILGRWQYSSLRYTFDTERSWQAGLAAILSVFLLAWLCYSTTVTVLTIKHQQIRAVKCALQEPQLQNNSSSSYQLSASDPSSLPLSFLKEDDGETNTSKTLKTSSPSSPSISVSSTHLLASTSHLPSMTSQPSLSTLGMLSNKPTGNIPKHHPSNDSEPVISHAIASDQNRSRTMEKQSFTLTQHSTSRGTASLSHDKALHGNNKTSNSSDVEDPRVKTDNVREECLECNRMFLTWCFSVFMFDWAYMVALLLNLLFVGSVPRCCLATIQE